MAIAFQGIISKLNITRRYVSVGDNRGLYFSNGNYRTEFKFIFTVFSHLGVKQKVPMCIQVYTFHLVVLFISFPRRLNGNSSWIRLIKILTFYLHGLHFIYSVCYRTAYLLLIHIFFKYLVSDTNSPKIHYVCLNRIQGSVKIKIVIALLEKDS